MSGNSKQMNEIVDELAITRDPLSGRVGEWAVQPAAGNRSELETKRKVNGATGVGGGCDGNVD